MDRYFSDFGRIASHQSPAVRLFCGAGRAVIPFPLLPKGLSPLTKGERSAERRGVLARHPMGVKRHALKDACEASGASLVTEGCLASRRSTTAFFGLRSKLCVATLSQSRIASQSFNAAFVSELLAARPYYPAVGFRDRPSAWLPPRPQGPFPPPLSGCLRKAPLVETGCANQNIEQRNDQERRLCTLVRVCAKQFR